MWGWKEPGDNGGSWTRRVTPSMGVLRNRGDVALGGRGWWGWLDGLGLDLEVSSNL